MAIYDVLKVIKKENLGKVDFDEQLKKLNQRVYIPNWFTVDLKIGVCTQNLINFKYNYIVCNLQMPTIVLGQDEVDCFAAWVSVEAGMPDHADLTQDIKVDA